MAIVSALFIILVVFILCAVGQALVYAFVFMLKFICITLFKILVVFVFIYVALGLFGIM